jgi:beta-lactamase regulating signal transducer with metallopeptidase domain
MAEILETLSTDLFYRLGWVLLHSLWQFALIAVVLAVAIETLRRRSAALRYIVCCGALAGTIPVAVATYALIPGSAITDSQPTDNHIVANPLPPAAPVLDEPLLAIPDENPSKPEFSGEHFVSPDLPSETPVTVRPSIGDAFVASDPGGSLEEPRDEEATATSETEIATGTQPVEERLTAVVRPWLPMATVAWLCGVLLLSIWHLGGWFGVLRLARMAREPADQDIVNRLQEIAAKLKLRQSVRLFQSALVEIPIIIGWWRPVLLTPIGMVTGMNPQQLDSLLAHELAHVRRHDYLVNLFQTAMETLLFYHPAIWWISRKIRVEREYCCDDVAVDVCGDGMEYARALATFEERRSAPQPAVAASEGNTLSRVRRLLGISAATNWTAKSLVGSLAVVVLVAGTIACFVRSIEDTAAADNDAILGHATAEKTGVQDERAELLREHADEFEFSLEYRGKEEMSYRSLLLEGPAAPPRGPLVAGCLGARLSKEQVLKLIEHLRTEGFLANAANIAEKEMAFPTGPTYTLIVRGPERTAFYEELGWDLKMIDRIDAIATVLEGSAAKAMQTLIDRLSDQRKEWKALSAVSPADDSTSIEGAYKNVVSAATRMKPAQFVVGGAGQQTTGLGLSVLLKLSGQQKDIDAFTDDHRYFERDVKRLAKDKKTWALCALLDHENVDAKIYTARGLRQLADPGSVPVLLAAAKRNNYVVEGSESATLHSIYRSTIKDAMEKITGEQLTPAGLRVTTYPEPGKPKVIRSEDDPSHFREEVDFAKVEKWLAEARPVTMRLSYAGCKPVPLPPKLEGDVRRVLKGNPVHSFSKSPFVAEWTAVFTIDGKKYGWCGNYLVYDRILNGNGKAAPDEELLIWPCPSLEPLFHRMMKDGARTDAKLKAVLARHEETLYWGKLAGGLRMSASGKQGEAVLKCLIRNHSSQPVRYSDYTLGYFEAVSLRARPVGESHWTDLPRIEKLRYLKSAGGTLDNIHVLGAGESIPLRINGRLVDELCTFDVDLAEFQWPQAWQGELEVVVTQQMGYLQAESAERISTVPLSSHPVVVSLEAKNDTRVPVYVSVAPPGSTVSVWGDSVEGVRCRLRGDRAVWNHGDKPTFKIDIHNDGPKTRTLPPGSLLYEIEVDGRWYIWAGDIGVASPAVKPGKGLTDIPLRVDGNLYDFIVRTEDGLDTRRLGRLSPGRHTIRVACSVGPADATTKQFRVVSNPVVIDVVESQKTSLRHVRRHPDSDWTIEARSIGGFRSKFAGDWMPLSSLFEGRVLENLDLSSGSDSWLLMRGKTLDMHDRIWIENIERRGNRIVIQATQAVWQDDYERNVPCRPYFGVNLGRLPEGKYEAEWHISSTTFEKPEFDATERPKDALPVNGPAQVVKTSFVVVLLELEAQVILDRLNGKCASKAWRSEIDLIESRKTRGDNGEVNEEARAFVSDCKGRLLQLGVSVKWNAAKGLYEVRETQKPTQAGIAEEKGGTERKDGGSTNLTNLVHVDMFSQDYTTQHPLVCGAGRDFPTGREMIFRDTKSQSPVHAVFPRGVAIPDDFTGHFVLRGHFQGIRNWTSYKLKRPSNNYRYFVVSSYEQRENGGTRNNSVAPAERKRAEVLKADPLRLHLAIEYHGGKDESYSSLVIYHGMKLDTHHRRVKAMVDASQAKKIIDHLAAEGFLANASNIAERKTKSPQGAAYTLKVYRPKSVQFYEVLGWGPQMVARLKALHKVLEGDAAEKMAELLAGLEDVALQEKTIDLGKDRIRFESCRWDEVKPGLFAVGHVQSSKELLIKNMYQLRQQGKIPSGRRQLVGRLPSMLYGFGIAGGSRLIVDHFVRQGNLLSAEVTNVLPLDGSDLIADAVYLEASLPDDLPPGRYRVAIHFTDAVQFNDTDKLLRRKAEPTIDPMTCEFVVPEQDNDEKEVLSTISRSLRRLAKEHLPGHELKEYADGRIRIAWKTQHYDVPRPTGKHADAEIVTRRETGPAPGGLILTAWTADQPGQADRPQTLDNGGLWKTYLGERVFPGGKKWLMFNLDYGPKTDKNLIETFSSPTNWLNTSSPQLAWGKADAAHGLCAGLSMEGRVVSSLEPMAVTFHLKNVTNKPIEVPLMANMIPLLAVDFWQLTFKPVSLRGRYYEYMAIEPEARRADWEPPALGVLKPGQSMTGRQVIDPRTWRFLAGEGSVMTWLPPGKYTVTAKFLMPAGKPEIVVSTGSLHATITAGAVETTSGAVEEEPTEKATQRTRALKADIDKFRLSLWRYDGGRSSKHVNLTLNVAGAKQDDNGSPFGGFRHTKEDEARTNVQIDEQLAAKIIDHLATRGFLDRARNTFGHRMEPYGFPGVTMSVTGPAKTEYFEELNWGLPMLKRLEALHAVLRNSGAAEGAISDFLAPLKKLGATVELGTDWIQFEGHKADDVKPELLPAGMYARTRGDPAKEAFLKRQAGKLTGYPPYQELLGRVPRLLPAFNEKGGARLVVDRYEREGTTIKAYVKYMHPEFPGDYVQNAVYLRASLPDDIPPGKYLVTIHFGDYTHDGRPILARSPSIAPMTCELPVPASPEPRQGTIPEKPADALSLTVRPAKGTEFPFGQITDTVFTIKNESDKAVNVGRIGPMTNTAEEHIALSGTAYGSIHKHGTLNRFEFNEKSQQATRENLHVGFLLPRQEVSVRVPYRPLFTRETFRIQYASAEKNYDGSAASLAPLKVYIPGKTSDGTERTFDPFDAKRWVDICKTTAEVRPPGPDAPKRSVLIPGLGEGAKAVRFPMQFITVKIPLAVDGDSFLGEKAMAVAAKIDPDPMKLRVTYCGALGGYVVLPGTRDAWILTSSDQTERGKKLPLMDVEVLRDIDRKDYVSIRVGDKQEGFGSSVKPSGRKLWDKYPIEYGDGMYTRGEFIRIDKTNFAAFLDEVRTRDLLLTAHNYFFRSRYFILRKEPTSLPGSTVSADEAIGNRDFAFVGMCEALEATTAQAGPSGIHGAKQRFKLLEILAGDEPTQQTIELAYSILTIIEPPEAVLAKGDQVLWVVWKKDDTLVGIKTIADTPENRKAVAGIVGKKATKPIEGIQLKLRADSAVWKQGETPTFKIDIHNDGPKAWALPAGQPLYEIEVDGRWHEWMGPIDMESPLVKPGKGLTDIPLHADGKFFQHMERVVDKPNMVPLSFPPGRHVVRVACSPDPEDATKTKRVRVVSNPVTIDVVEYVQSRTDQARRQPGVAYLIDASPAAGGRGRVVAKEAPLTSWLEGLELDDLDFSADTDSWLLMRGKLLDTNDRVWIDAVKRRENSFVIRATQAIWPGEYGANVMYRPYFGVNLGRLPAGKYEAEWHISTTEFEKLEFDVRGRPKDQLRINDPPQVVKTSFVVAPAETPWSGPVGLSGRLVVAQPTITPKEQFDLSLELRNVNRGGSPWLAVQEGNPFLFEARVTDAVGKAVKPTMQRVDVLYSPKWRVIRPFPDERLKIPVSIRSEDGAAGSHLDTTTNIWKLPPGKYKISGTYRSAEEVRYEGEATPWAGKLVIPPVDVEVIAEEANAKTEIEAIVARLKAIEAECVPGKGTSREEVEKRFGKGKPVVGGKISTKPATPDSRHWGYEFCDNGTLLVRYDNETNSKVLWAYYLDPYSTKGRTAEPNPQERLRELKPRLKQMETILVEYRQRFQKENPANSAVNRDVHARVSGLAEPQKLTPPPKERLPGSRLSLQKAIKDGYTFILVCEAGPVRSSDNDRLGQYNAVQEMKVLEALVGEMPKEKTISLHYAYLDLPDVRERLLREGEKVLWIGWTREYVIGAKALADTSEYRKAIAEIIRKNETNPSKESN